MARLGDICTLVNGYAFKPTDWKTEGLPIIRIQNLNDTTAPFNYFNGEIDRKYVVNDGDLLFSWSGTPGTSFGAFFWRRGKGVLNQHIFNVYPVDGINKAYLRYALNGNISRIIDKAHGGVGLQHITKKELVEIDIPILSEEQQKQIVIVLDSVDKLIVLRKEQLTKLDQLVKSRFIELFGDTILNPFGWQKDVLSTVCEVRDGTHDSPQYYEVGYPLVTSKNVTGGKIDLTDCSLICETDFKKINERSKVDLGDIIMPMIGTVGKPVIVDIEPNFAIKNVSLIKFKSDSKVLNIYVRALLQSDYFDDVVLSKVRGGTQKFISLGDIRKLEILVPPLNVQEQFANFVEQTDKSKLTIQASLDKLELMKNALMQKYFG